jgi:hypothetical protein
MTLKDERPTGAHAIGPEEDELEDVTQLSQSGRCSPNRGEAGFSRLDYSAASGSRSSTRRESEAFESVKWAEPDLAQTIQQCRRVR